jgi:CRP/FNR family transcriptional regulator, anaerobic regulatory protein
VALAEDVVGEERASKSTPPFPTRKYCTLGLGDYLYQEADARPFIYRVEKGVIVVFERQFGRPVKIIAVAGKGDSFGLGCLEHHHDNARAVVESVVSYVPRTELSVLAEQDPQLQKKQNEVVARNFQHGKRLARDRGRAAPIECVAAFLVALSRQNANEGRDPSLVAGSCECVSTASLLLDLDTAVFERALVRVQRMGLVEPLPNGLLHLKDIPALEGVADGGSQVNAELDSVPASVAERGVKDAGRSHMLRLFAGASALTAGPWRAELHEALWLVSVIGGISVMAVGLALIVAAGH